MRKLQVAIALSLALTTFGFAEVVYPVSSPDIDIASSGRVYAQTLTVPVSDPILDEFTVQLRATAEPTQFVFEVCEWDTGSNSLVGSFLYTSAPHTALPGAGYPAFTFEPNLTLVPGGTYIALIDHTNYPSLNGLRVGGNYSAAYAGGAFAFPSGANYQSWIVSTDGLDLAFGARFIPEPATLAPLALLLLSAVRVRRRG